MEQKNIIQKTADFAKEKLHGEGSGHDWWHVYRVWKMSINLAEEEDADLFVTQLAALLHDIADWKFCDGDETVGPKIAREFLVELNVEKDVVDDVCSIIKNISFKGARAVVDGMNSKEGMVVQDADRLDAIGAVGIARTFAYGGFAKRSMYEPEIKPQLHKAFEQYKKNNSPTVNHFYEKLLLLKDLMNTQAAKRIALKRHKFMEDYLDVFFEEWEGKK